MHATQNSVLGRIQEANSETVGFKTRHKLYQLYRFLNYPNLFGGGYYNMADTILDELLRKMNEALNNS